MRFPDEDTDRRTRTRLDLLIALMVVQIVLSIGLWVDRYRNREEPRQEPIAAVTGAQADYDPITGAQASSATAEPIAGDISLPVRSSPEPAPIAPPQIKVQILNGCGKTGIAKKAREYLTKRDYEVRDVGNADRQDYRFSEVVNRGNNATAARDLAHQLGIDESRIKRKPAAPGLDVELTFIIGADFRKLPFGR